MTIYTHKDSNIFKTWLLMVSFLIGVIFLGWFFGFVYNQPFILYIAVIFAVLTNIFSYWYSDKIVIKMSGAKPALRSDYFDFYTIVENLSITAGLPMPKIFVINDNVPNAFATGRNPEHAVVAVTTGLLLILDKNELEGVVAHELSHIGNRDMLLSTVVVVLAGFVAILSDIFLRATIHGGRSNDSGKGGGALVIIGLLLAIASPIAAGLIQLAISRKREFLADASGALLTRYPEGLASALRKISSHTGKMKRANKAMAHLYISSPFGEGKVVGFFTRLWSTHPPIDDRIKALMGDK